MNKHSELVLEDRQIYGLNKVHKNVLKAAPDVYNTKVITNSKASFNILFNPIVNFSPKSMMIPPKTMNWTKWKLIQKY